MNKQNLFTIQIDTHDTKKALKACDTFLLNDKCNLLFFLNAHCFNIAQRNPDYYEAIGKAELLLNDGIGIRIAGLLSGIRLKENMNGTDFIPKLLEHLHPKGIKVFLLGGKKGIAERAKSELEKKYQGIQIAGTYHGYFEDSDNLINIINDSGANLLIAGMGVPRQELWLCRHAEKFRHIKICIGGGAILDFISREIPRAPIWMRKSSTEWIFRLIREPRRLFKRYIFGNILFFFHVIRLLLNRKNPLARNRN